MSLRNSELLVSRVLSVLRIVSAYVLLQHGSAKLLGYPKVAYFDNLQIFSLLGAAGILELVGGVLLLVGLFTRPTAFVLSGLLAFAYFITQAPKGNVEILEFNEFGPKLAVLPYCHTDHYWQVYFDTNKTIADTLGAAGLTVTTRPVKVYPV